MIFDSENCVEEYLLWRECNRVHYSWVMAEGKWWLATLSEMPLGDDVVPTLVSEGVYLYSDKVKAIQPLFPPSDNEASTVRMPRELTAENGGKVVMIGEFEETRELNCMACHYGNEDDNCEVCGGKGEYLQTVTVSWSTIKDIYKKAVQHFST